MKLVDIKHFHSPFDVPAGLGASLIASGNFEQYVPPAAPTRIPNTTWQVKSGTSLISDNSEPCIVYSCTSCGDKGMLTGPTAERTQVARHCGVTEQVPPEIQAEYRKLRRLWDGVRNERVKSLRERAELLKTSVVRTV